MDQATIKIENYQQLIRVINGLLPAVRNKVVIDAMIAGANKINDQARSRLMASKKNASKTAYSYYSTAFRMENLRGKTPEEIGIRLGVWDKRNGYKLRWLEWGTRDRYTHRMKNRVTGEVSGRAFRGKVIGSHYFFGSVVNQEEAVFKIVAEAVEKSLEASVGKNNS